MNKPLSVILIVLSVSILSCQNTNQTSNETTNSDQNSQSETDDIDEEQIDVPQSLLDVFAKLHPRASEVQWDKEGDVYEAEFNDGDMHMELSLDQKGELLYVGNEVELNELPASARNYIRENHYGKDYVEIFKIHGKAGLHFEVELEDDIDLRFGPMGNLIK